MNIRYMYFYLYQWKWGTNFIFQKNNVRNFKKLQSIKYFCLFWKYFMSKQRILPFLNNPPFCPTPTYLEKIFHPHPDCQIRGSQPPLFKGGHSKYGCYTYKTWNHFCQYHSMLHSFNLIFVKLTESDFRSLHLQNLISLLTISFYTTLTQLDSHYICTVWFQGSAPVQSEIFARVLLYTTFIQPDFYYICTTWFQGSTPAQPEVFVIDIIAHYTSITWLYYIHITWFQSSTLAQPELAHLTHFMLHTHTLIRT